MDTYKLINSVPAYPVVESRKEFLEYIHNYRGLAIVFIVAVHVSSLADWGAHAFQEQLVVSLFANGTIMFVFISGFLFYHLNKETFNYRAYLKSRFLKIILPYLLVSIPAILYKLYFHQVEHVWWMDAAFEKRSVPGKIAYMIATGRHIGPFWFIPMISLIYLITPLIVSFARTKGFLVWAPIISILGLFTFQYGYRSTIFLSFLYFFPVYLFGIWIYRLRDFVASHATAFLIVAIVIWLSVTALELTGIINAADNIGLRELNHAVFRFNFFKLKMYGLTLFFYLVFLKAVHRPTRLLGSLGMLSFGIYFVHPYVIKAVELLEMKGLIGLQPLNIVSYLIALTGVVVICMGVVWFAKKLLGHKSRYILGT